MVPLPVMVTPSSVAPLEDSISSVPLSTSAPPDTVTPSCSVRVWPASTVILVPPLLTVPPLIVTSSRKVLPTIWMIAPLAVSLKLAPATVSLVSVSITLLPTVTLPSFKWALLIVLAPVTSILPAVMLSPSELKLLMVPPSMLASFSVSVAVPSTVMVPALLSSVVASSSVSALPAVTSMEFWLVTPAWSSVTSPATERIPVGPTVSVPFVMRRDVFQGQGRRRLRRGHGIDRDAAAAR